MDGILFLGCVVLLLAFAALAWYYRTLLFGLSGLNVFAVATASLSGFFFATVFGIEPLWMTPEHYDVLVYSEIGLLAMLGGIFFAWRDMHRSHHLATVEFNTDHMNADLGWITFWAGAVAELAFPFVYGIPTVSTTVFCLTLLQRIGLCILLVAAFRSSEWRRFGIALGVFAGLSIVGSLMTGFSFIRLNTIVPLLVVWLFYRGLNLRSIVGMLVGVTLMFMGVNAWLQTRDLIRSGALESLPIAEQITTFFGEYWTRFVIPDLGDTLLTIHERIDMSDVLSSQVRFQPDIEPYAHGETIYGIAYALVPRMFWPEKPEVAGGSAFVARYTGLWRSDADATSVGLPYQFELYANGGPLWVILGLGIIGYIGGRLELRLFKKPKTLGGYWALALVTAVICEGGQRGDVVIPALIASGIGAYALGWLVQRFLPQMTGLGFAPGSNARMVQSYRGSAGRAGLVARRSVD
jgi:hypothetical protein